jgi:hypothetical protein
MKIYTWHDHHVFYIIYLQHFFMSKFTQLYITCPTQQNMHIDAEFEGELQLHPSDYHGQSEPTDTSAP